MRTKLENICRLCLRVAKDEFAEIDEVIKEMFNILLLKLDLNLTIDPIICQDCVEVAKKCLDFKLTCFGTERIILLFSTGRQNSKYDIRNIHKEKEDVNTVADKDLDICRVCMTRFEIDNFGFLDILRKESNMFDMLPGCIPEMDFNMIENPLICKPCKEDLENYLKFVAKCWDVEGKIQLYCKKEGIYGIDKVNLGNMKYLYKYTLECPGECPIKEEPNVLDTECIYPETYNQLLKHEELDIKEEDINSGKNSFNNLPNIRLDKLSDKFKETKTKPSPTQQRALKNLTKFCGPSKRKEKDSVNGNKIYKCALCAYKTKWRSNLKRHSLVHKQVSEIEIHKCSFCTYKTKWKYCLKNHILLHKDVTETEMHHCSLCTYETKKKSSLNKHMLVHKDVSEIKMYKCSLCAYEGKQEGLLKSHMLVHSKINLKRHMLVHKNTQNV